MVGDFESLLRALVVGAFVADRSVAKVVVVAKDGLEEGGPILGSDKLVPLIDLLVTAQGAELVEELAEVVGFVEEAGVVVEEELGATGKG